jgi:hypothetical protein
MADIFISYAREDRDKALKLAEVLRQRGWPPWQWRLASLTVIARSGSDEAIHACARHRRLKVDCFTGCRRFAMTGEALTAANGDMNTAPLLRARHHGEAGM